MTITELTEELETLKAKYGDIHVRLGEGSAINSIAVAKFFYDKDGQEEEVFFVLLADKASTAKFKHKLKPKLRLVDNDDDQSKH